MTVRLHRRGFVTGTAALSAALWAPRPGRAAAAMDFDEARHLLSRTAFGATPAEIRAIEALDYPAAVDQLLATFRPTAATAAPGWANDGLGALRDQQKAMAKVTADGRAVQVQPPLQEQGRELRNWWIEEMLATDQPLVERMVLFWHNHFTSSLTKTYYPGSLYRQNEMFRASAFGNFATLLKSVARDPAMLLYLDGVRNVARQPNENFARELLELFTLGEGHYTESDIKAAARAFTGWSVDRETGRFVERAGQHDDGEKTFLGQTGRFGGDEIIAILLKHPRTAETIVEKMWREFVSLTPDPAAVKRLAAPFRDGGYELKPLLRALLLQPALRDPANRGALIKSPVDLIVGTVRVLGLPVPEKTQLARMMQGLGQSLFNPPNVKGWAGGESWITAYTLLQRQQILRRIVEATTVASMEGMGGRRMDRRQAQPAMEDTQQMMEPRPVEGRSLRNSSGAARLGPTLLGVDAATLSKTLLPFAPIDAVETGGAPGAVVAAALLDPAYQLK
ncbi:MAG: DUF1800 domain-containing protein [Reyranella sp.]|nr:DUF1800 domain-containing protein [Reyranella sp.]